MYLPPALLGPIIWTQLWGSKTVRVRRHLLAAHLESVHGGQIMNERWRGILYRVRELMDSGFMIGMIASSSIVHSW